MVLAYLSIRPTENPLAGVEVNVKPTWQLADVVVTLAIVLVDDDVGYAQPPANGDIPNVPVVAVQVKPPSSVVRPDVVPPAPTVKLSIKILSGTPVEGELAFLGVTVRI